MADKNDLLINDNRAILKATRGAKSTSNKDAVNRFLINSYNWNSMEKSLADDNKGLNKYRSPVYLEVTEFQPTYFFNWITGLQNMISKYGAIGLTALEGLGSFDAKVSNVLLNTDLINGSNVNTQLLINEATVNDSDVLGIPMTMVNSMLQGRYVSYYELPYNPEDKIQYKANGDNGWAKDGEASSSYADNRRSEKIAKAAEAGGRVSKAVQKIDMVSNIIKNNFPVSYIQAPDWKPESIHDAPEISFEFYLYNNNIHNLKKNYMFLTTFIAGAHWMYINAKSKSPNVYTVHLPGFYEYKYCTLDVSVASIGNTRVMRNNTQLNIIRGATGFNLPDNALFPDIYKVSCTFKSIVPNNFNVYVNYLINGKDSEKVQIGKSSSIISNLKDAAFNATQTGLNMAKESAQPRVDFIKNHDVKINSYKGDIA